MYLSVVPFFIAISAIAWAAATHISSVIVVAFTSKVPLNIAGKPRLLLIWLSKSLRPVPTTLAPAAFASHGQISGIGLAQAKTILSEAIFETHSFLTTFGADLDAEIMTSAPSIATPKSPSRPSLFVLWAKSYLKVS